MSDPRPTERLRPPANEASVDSTHHCPDCAGSVVNDGDTNERVCDNCGLVIDSTRLDRGPEWRSFTHRDRQQQSRVGAPTTQLLHDKGLTTTIDWQDKDAAGRSLSAEKRSQFHRLRTWQERIRTQDAGERNLQFALTEINRMAAALGVPKSVREVASVIYRRALDADLIRGRSIEGMATATLYAACRLNGVPRSLSETTAVSRVRRQEIGRTYRYLARELGLEMTPVNPTKFVPRFCSKLGCSPEVEAKATEIIDLTTKLGLHAGKSPAGYAGAAIYAAARLCNEQQNQRDVADVAQVSVVTIRNRYQEQLESLEYQ